MISFLKFAVRNPSYITQETRKSWVVRKAMNAYRDLHAVCAFCGKEKDLEVHHIQPVSVAPEIAADPSNMLTLCNRCHLSVGHLGNYGGRYTQNIRELCTIKQGVEIRNA